MSAASPRDDRPLLVTSALPYANGPIHFGHVTGAYLPADIYVRYQRLRAVDVLFICGTDEHGVSITVNAERQHVPYADYVAHWHAAIKDVFDRFGIAFDHFARTSVDSPEHPHRRLSQEFFVRLLAAGAIGQRRTQQHYCTTCRRFLPDRYVEGTCYVCQQPAARGDECKACGTWLEAVRILDPVCVTCRSSPELRETMQYELDLSPWSDLDRLASGRPESHPTFRNWIERCFRGGELKANVRTMVFEKLLVEGEGLRGRPITRDLPWGVPLPASDLLGRPIEGHDQGKVLYVWFDAPIGYVSATMAWAAGWARRTGGAASAARAAWRRFWITDRGHDYSTPRDATRDKGFPGPRLVHFIGKDNIPFHCVVFPAMLAWQSPATAADATHAPGGAFLGPGPGERWVLPETVPANEFYNLEGRKFSTSDNWMLDSARLVEVFGKDALRWYLTVTMPETGDSQFRFAGLRDTVNADLANTIGNYASRVLKFVGSHLGGVVPEPDPAFDHGLMESDLAQGLPATPTLDRARSAATTALALIGQELAAFHFRGAAQFVRGLAAFGNLWFDHQKPWLTRKLPDLGNCRTALWAHCQILSALAVALWPFLPDSADRLRRMLGLPSLSGLDGERADRRHTLTAADDLWRFVELEASHALGEPGILFQKIEETVIEAERARLSAPA